MHTAAMTLYANHITPLLWDNWNAFTTEGKLLFRPDEPMTHAQVFTALFLAQKALGPLFNDYPIDGRNGRYVPPALYERLEMPQAFRALNLPLYHEASLKRYCVRVIGLGRRRPGSSELVGRA